MIETPIREAPAPVEPTTPLKLSEALRLGSLTTKQGFNRLQGPAPDEFCAIGTIVHVLGMDDVSGQIPARRHTQLHLGVSAACDCVRPSVHPSTVWYVTEHLNDFHRWTREKIADWLESQGL
jgi:hypothetical protein